MGYRRYLVLALLLITGLTPQCLAGYFEISAGFSFQRKIYFADSHTWSRTWSLSGGYFFTEFTAIELGFEDSYQRTYIRGYQDTTTQDRVYSVSWIQGFLPRKVPFQPYLRLGGGQVNRDMSGAYADGSLPYSRYDQLTVVLGAGFKILMTQQMGIRLEVRSYLDAGKISTFQDNIGFMAGGSLYL